MVDPSVQSACISTVNWSSKGVTPSGANFAPHQTAKWPGAGRHSWIEIRLLLERSLTGAVHVESAIGQHVNVLEPIILGERVSAKGPNRTGRITRFDKGRTS